MRLKETHTYKELSPSIPKGTEEEGYSHRVLKLKNETLSTELVEYGYTGSAYPSYC